jgi:hypothetical protein
VPGALDASFVRLRSAAERVEQVEIGDGDRVLGLHHADVVVLEEAAEGEPVVERDGRRGLRARFLACAGEDLAGGDEPAGRRRSVVVERAAQVADPLATDLATVLADDDGGADLVRAGLVDAAEVRLASGRSGAWRRRSMVRREASR